MARRHRCRDLAHAALWQIPAGGTNAPTRLQQCVGRPRLIPLWGEAGRSLRLVGRRPSCIRSGISCAPCREVPWRRPPSSIRARPRSAASRPSFPRVPFGGGSRGSRRRRRGGLRERRAHQEQGCEYGRGRAGRYRDHGRHLGCNNSATSRCDHEPWMNEAGPAVIRDYYILPNHPPLRCHVAPLR